MDGYAAAGGPLPDDRAVPGFGSRAFPEDDFDLDGYFDWLAGEIEAGRLRVPEAALGGPAASLSPGEACDVDLVLLAAMCGPQGPGGQAAAAFGQDQEVGAAAAAAFGRGQARPHQARAQVGHRPTRPRSLPRSRDRRPA
jgi:hypothetical protein